MKTVQLRMKTVNQEETVFAQIKDVEMEKAAIDLDNLRTMFSTQNISRPAGLETARSVTSPKKAQKEMQIADSRRAQQIDIFVRRSQITPSQFASAINSLTLKNGVTAETVELVAGLFQGKQHEQVPSFIS